jgi:tetratricopeptide (TPR) repeat protein
MESTDRTDQAGAESLAAALGHLPLALDHAAAYLRRTGIDFATYEALAAELLQRAPRGVDYETPVFATFSLAIDKAAEACPEAQKLMGLCAYLAPDRIPLSLFTDDVLSETARLDAVAALQEVSLAAPEPLDDGSPGLTMHRLVQATMRARLKEMGEHDNAAALATELVADAFPADLRLMPHAMAALTHAPDSGNGADKTSLLLNQIVRSYIARSLAIQAGLVPDHTSVARNLHTMRDVMQDVVDELDPGHDDSNVARGLVNVARMLHFDNRLAEAELFYRRALTLDEATHGPDHSIVAIRLNNLADLLRAADRLAEAEPLYRRAVDALKKFELNAGHRHPRCESVIENLAALEADMRAAAPSAPAARYGGAMGSDPQGLTPTTAAPQGPQRKRGLMGGLFRRA